MNLKEIREKLGLTQLTASAFVGVSSITWSRWETGKQTPTPRAAGVIALLERAADSPECKYSKDLRYNPGAAPEDHITNCPRCQVARIGAINRGF